MSTTASVTVNWRELINDNKAAVSGFACGDLSYRRLAKELGPEARTHVYSMEKNLKVHEARSRARRALSRV